jgi:hypothetical protein
MTPEQIEKEIISLTPGWLEAKRAAERDGHQNWSLNLMEQDALKPIDRLLDQMIEVQLLSQYE